MKTGYNWSQFMVQVTPELAQKWLGLGNPSNRRISKTRVDSYAKMMNANQWLASPTSAISFSKDGMLLNGHHRLHAVIQSNSTVPFIVFECVPTEHLRIIDTELPRNAKAIGVMFGEDTRFDSALNVIAAAKDGGFGKYHSPLDIQELRDEYTNESKLVEPLLEVKCAGRSFRAGVIAGAMLSARIAPVETQQFVTDIVSACNRTSVGSKAARNLIKWVEGNIGAHSGSYTSRMSLNATCNAFEQFRKNLDLDHVKATQGTTNIFIAYIYGQYEGSDKTEATNREIRAFREDSRMTRIPGLHNNSND
jgi:hypothetical protein